MKPRPKYDATTHTYGRVQWNGTVLVQQKNTEFWFEGEVIDKDSEWLPVPQKD